MSERVRVAVRLRPMLEEELLSKDRSVCVDMIDTQKRIIQIKKDFERRQFQFDTVLDPKASQQAVYNDVAKNVVGSVLKGFNGTIFCYGQTGTGKTYTMMGKLDSEEKGITPRTFEQIFNEINSDHQNQYVVQLGYLQIYMEMLLDLIRPDNQDVKIRECPDSGVFVNGLEWLEVESPQECLSIMNFAEKNRVVAFTSLNAHSSRSHSMLIIKVEKRDSPQLQHTRSMTITKKPSSKMHNYSQDVITEPSEENTYGSVGTLYLVDLAGSERIKKSRATGDRLSEARSINYSLTALGKCIHALTGPKSTFVPFRDSKLTRILQDALGGNCKTALIINIGPAGKHVEETLSSLTFGMRAMKVTNTPFVNQNNKDNEIYTQFQQELDMKDEQITQLEQQQLKLLTQVQQLTEELNCKDSGNASHYKIKLEKAEEEHKQFLEEIDNMMVEQEQENEELTKKLDLALQELQEIKKSEESTNQAFLECKKMLEEEQQTKSELQSTIQDLHQLLLKKDQELQNMSLNSNRNSDVILQSKEKQNQKWRNELQSLTNQYVNKLEEFKRLEEKENTFTINNDQLKQLRYESQLIQDQLVQKNTEYQSLQNQYLKLQQSHSQLTEYCRQLQESNTQDQRQYTNHIQQLEQTNGEITKRLEQQEVKLKKQREQMEINEQAYLNELQQKNAHLSKIQLEYLDMQGQIAQIKESYNTIQSVNQSKIKNLIQDNAALTSRNSELQQQISQQLAQSKSSIFHPNQSYINEQNFEIELKKSITVSGVNEGQIVVEMQNRIQQLEEALESQINESQQKDLKLKDMELRCSRSQQEADLLRSQMDSFSKRSQQSLLKMEEAMCSEVVRSVLDKMLIQVELNSFDDLSSKAPDSELQFKSFSRHVNDQMVESMFINSRQSDAIIQECSEEESQQINHSIIEIPKKLRMSKSRQDSVFSFSEKQHKKDIISLDLSEINQPEEIQVQIDFSDQKSVDQFMRNIKKKQQDLSIGSIQQVKSPEQIPQTQKLEDLQLVVRAMAQMLLEKNTSDQSPNKNTLENLQSSMLDFNNLCNTLTTYFL